MTFIQAYLRENTKIPCKDRWWTGNSVMNSKSLSNEGEQNIHFLCTSSVMVCSLLNHSKLSQTKWNAEYNILSKGIWNK